MSEEQTGLVWVRLHLVPQSDNHAMPPYVTGILTQETTKSYVLVQVLEQVETDEGWIIKPSENMQFINSTYVWCCEVLNEPPQYGEFGSPFREDALGGLG